MSQNSKKKSLSIFVPLLAGAFVAKALWVGVDYKYLPKSGVEKEQKSTVKPLYYRYSLASKKDAPKPIVKKKPIIHKPVVKKQKPLEVKKFTLKGVIYENPKKGIATLEYKGKSYVLEIGEELEGFRLFKFAPKAVIFIKDGNSYKVELFKNKHSSSNINKNSYNSNISHISKPKEKPKVEKNINRDIKRDGDTTIISKNLFNKYKSNISLIRKNIGVAPVMENNKLKGFRVRYIKKGSDFEKVGVKSGDIITAINGEEITDLSVPIRFFNNINTISNATITIKRGNEEKELEYEVR
jgi:general secretion pathway protein C